MATFVVVRKGDGHVACKPAQPGQPFQWIPKPDREAILRWSTDAGARAFADMHGGRVLHHPEVTAA